MKYQIGDILTSPYPNDESLGLLVDEVKVEEICEPNPFRAKLYPNGYFLVLVMDSGEYKKWDRQWINEHSHKLA